MEDQGVSLVDFSFLLVSSSHQYPHQCYSRPHHCHQPHYPYQTSLSQALSPSSLRPPSPPPPSSPGQSPTVSHMSIYSGPSLADCTAPPAPPSRLPTLEARKVEVLVIFGRIQFHFIFNSRWSDEVVAQWESVSSLPPTLENLPGAACPEPRRMAL